MTAETVRALRRAGCAEVWMGVESGSQKILDAMDKGLRVEQVVAAREELRREGIRACFFLQFGYPGETWDDIQKTDRAGARDSAGRHRSFRFLSVCRTRGFTSGCSQQLGDKQNWSDSDDLCVMFKGAYTDTFYRACVTRCTRKSIRGSRLPASRKWIAGRRSSRAWKRVEFARTGQPQSGCDRTA